MNIKKLSGQDILLSMALYADCFSKCNLKNI